VLNNPLAYLDNNGLWLTYTHNIMLDEAFPGLSAQQLQTLHQASYDTDYTNLVDVGGGRRVSPQDPEASFVHGMSNGLTNQNGAAAQAL
jgi:hypothetical protein